MIIETSKPPTAPSREQSRTGLLWPAFQRQLRGVIVVAFVLTFLVVYFSPSMFISIQSGYVGVIYLRFLGGTQTDRIMGEGLKIIPPWDRVFLYNVRVQEYKHEMPVLTKEGLSVGLHISIRYHPEAEMVGMLHKRVGPGYRDKIVVPEVEAALRTIMGEFTMPQVYGSERGLVQKVINDSLEHVSQKFVKVDGIVLRSVELPQKVKDAVEEKMTWQELAEAYQYKLDRETKEAQRKAIEADGVKKYNDIINSSLTPGLLKWRAIEASKELATSPNAKTIVIGNTSGGLPVMLGGDK
jgi:regulator of protease activity HflC (stomatin/prohibitin superfamily)